MRHLALVLIVVLVSCKNEKTLEKFEIPKLVQLDKHDTVAFVNPKSILGVFPQFIGKAQFSKEIKINFDSVRRIPQIDRVDFSDDYWKWRESDSLHTDGLQLIVDNKTDIVFCGLKNYEPYQHEIPVYLVNETQHSKSFVAKDSYVFAYQEAKDSNGRWEPIEMRGFDFCGNGYWGVKIHPKEFVIFLIKRYKGNFKTSLRLKLENNGIIYYSKPYEGFIDEKQFLPKKYSE